MKKTVNLEKLDKALLALGIRDSLRGADYIRQGVALWTPGMCIHKELYPALAKAFGTTPSRVERAMRHAIETGWERAMPEDMAAYFGGTISPNKGKPTNGEFVARLWRVCCE